MLWWQKKQNKQKNLTVYPCSKCNQQIKVPKEYIDQFKPGGKEYHLDGQSYLHCPNCGEMLEIK